MFNTYPIPTLPEWERLSCDSPLTEQEIHKVLTTTENNKSPSIDGLSMNFYKHFWHVIAPELTSVYNYAFTQGTLTVTQCRGVITLLFKKGDHTWLKNWRPITLLTTNYKILTNALANCQKNVLPLIIHTNQTACVPGRTINDNISLIRDAVNFANKTDKPLAFISIDQMKTFHRVSHSLFTTLEKVWLWPEI